MEDFKISFQVLFLAAYFDGSLYILHKKKYCYRKSQDDWNRFLRMRVQQTGIRLLRRLLDTETQFRRSEKEKIMKGVESRPMTFTVSRKGRIHYIDEKFANERISDHFESFVRLSPDEKEMRFTVLFVRLWIINEANILSLV